MRRSCSFLAIVVLMVGCQRVQIARTVGPSAPIVPMGRYSVQPAFMNAALTNERAFRNGAESRAKIAEGPEQIEVLLRFVEVDERKAKQLVMNSKELAEHLAEGVFELGPSIDMSDSSLFGASFTAFDWKLRMLEAEGIVTVFAGPRILVRSGENGTIVISSRAPWANSGRSAMNRVLELSITPTLLESGEIDLRGLFSLSMAPAGKSPQTGFAEMAAVSGLTAPFYQVRFDINAIGKSGERLNIGSWPTEQMETVTSGVPVLRNIPVLGRMFERSKSMFSLNTSHVLLSSRIVSKGDLD